MYIIVYNIKILFEKFYRPYNSRSTDTNSGSNRRLSISRQQPPPQQQQTLQQQQPQHQLNPSNSTYNPMYNALQIPFTDSSYFSPRRSVPEIKAKNTMMSQMKRNSYQEETKFNVSFLQNKILHSIYEETLKRDDTE